MDAFIPYTACEGVWEESIEQMLATHECFFHTSYTTQHAKEFGRIDFQMLACDA